MVCYLIAKDVNKHGCYALKTSHGKHLSKMVRELNAAVGRRGVQIVVISRPSAYGEYSPYSFAKNEEEFKKMVISMK